MPRGHKVLSCAQETLRPLRNARSRSRNIKSERSSGVGRSCLARWPCRIKHAGFLPFSEVQRLWARFLLGRGRAWTHLRAQSAFSGLTMPELFGSGVAVLPRCRADTSLSLTAIPSQIHRISSDLRS